MDELKLMEDLCRDVAPTRRRALDQGRARLLLEINGPRRGRARRSRSSRTVVRTAAVGALALAIAAGITIAQNVGGDTPSGRHGQVGILPRPVANSREVALRANAAAQAQPGSPLMPGQWIFVKTRVAETDGAPLGPDPRTTTYEEWRTVEGEEPPRKDGVFAAPSEPTAKVLIGMPTDPDGALSRLYDEVDRIRELEKRAPSGQGAGGPFSFSVREGITGTPRGVAAFNLVSAILESYYVPPRLQAVLYSTLARIPEVKTLPDSVDAQGRHGLALYVMSEGYIRQELILDRNTYRYLGSRFITITDHTVPTPPENVETDSRKPMHIKKGSVLGWSALLASAPVTRPGDRP